MEHCVLTCWRVVSALAFAIACLGCEKESTPESAAVAVFGGAKGKSYENLIRTFEARAQSNAEQCAESRKVCSEAQEFSNQCDEQDQSDACREARFEAGNCAHIVFRSFIWPNNRQPILSMVDASREIMRVSTHGLGWDLA